MKDFGTEVYDVYGTMEDRIAMNEDNVSMANVIAWNTLQFIKNTHEDIKRDVKFTIVVDYAYLGTEFSCGHMLYEPDRDIETNGSEVYSAWYYAEEDMVWSIPLKTSYMSDEESEEAQEQWDNSNYEDMGTIHIAFYSWDQYDDRKCLKCELVNGYTSPFANTVLSHGVSAFNSVNSVRKALNRIEDISMNSQWEICCSCTTNNCGPIGIWGSGNISLSFKSDIWSLIVDGERTLHYENIEEYLETWDKDRYVSEFKEEWLATSLSDGYHNGHSHSEHWVSNTKISSVWVKDFYWQDITLIEKNYIKMFCRTHGYDLVIVYKQGTMGHKVIEYNNKNRTGLGQYKQELSLVR